MALAGVTGADRCGQVSIARANMTTNRKTIPAIINFYRHNRVCIAIPTAIPHYDHKQEAMHLCQ